MRSVLTALALTLMASGPALPTTWFPHKVSDPFSDGECDVFMWGSYGSYIYEWPEKRDAVFWPWTAGHWLWACGQSGFVWVGWGDDFELSDAERARIAAFLETAPPLVEDAETPWRGEESVTYYTFESRFERFRELSELRDLPVRERRMILAVQAHYLDRHFGDQQTALATREATIPLLEELTEMSESPVETMHFLATLGDYHFQLGRPEIADEYLHRAAAFEWVDDDGEVQTSHWYIDGLIEEIRADWVAAVAAEE